MNNLKTLMNQFKIAGSIKEIINLGTDIYSITREHISNSRRTKTIEEWEKLLFSLPKKEEYLVKMLKQRMREVIKNNEPYSKVYFFADDVVEYLHKTEPELFRINFSSVEEDEYIPFSILFVLSISSIISALEWCNYII